MLTGGHVLMHSGPLWGGTKVYVYVCMGGRHQRVFVSFISFIRVLLVFTVAAFLIVCWEIDLSWKSGMRV